MIFSVAIYSEVWINHQNHFVISYGFNTSSSNKYLGLNNGNTFLNLFIIHLQLSSVTSYFDVYSLSIDKHKNKDNPKIYLTAEESPSDPSTEE